MRLDENVVIVVVGVDVAGNGDDEVNDDDDVEDDSDEHKILFLAGNKHRSVSSERS